MVMAATVKPDTTPMQPTASAERNNRMATTTRAKNTSTEIPCSQNQRMNPEIVRQPSLYDFTPRIVQLVADTDQPAQQRCRHRTRRPPNPFGSSLSRTLRVY